MLIKRIISLPMILGVAFGLALTPVLVSAKDVPEFQIRLVASNKSPKKKMKKKTVEVPEDPVDADGNPEAQIELKKIVKPAKKAKQAKKDAKKDKQKEKLGKAEKPAKKLREKPEQKSNDKEKETAKNKSVKKDRKIAKTEGDPKSEKKNKSEKKDKAAKKDRSVAAVKKKSKKGSRPALSPSAKRVADYFKASPYGSEDPWSEEDKSANDAK